MRGQGISAAIRGEQVSDETRARAAARLRYLWRWEAANVLLLPTFALLLLRSNRSELGLPSASGLALCSAELAIGSAYAVGEFPKLYFWATLVTAFVAGLFAITSFLSGLARTSLARWAMYRIVVAGAVLVVHFLRAKEAVAP